MFRRTPTFFTAVIELTPFSSAQKNTSTQYKSNLAEQVRQLKVAFKEVGGAISVTKGPIILLGGAASNRDSDSGSDEVAPSDGPCPPGGLSHS